MYLFIQTFGEKSLGEQCGGGGSVADFAQLKKTSHDVAKFGQLLFFTPGEPQVQGGIERKYRE